MKIPKTNNFLTFLGFFNGFIYPFGFLSYLLVINFIRVKFSLLEVIFLILLLIIFFINLLKLYDQNYFILFNSFRFFFGFIIFYICFKNFEVFKIENIYKYLVILIFFEAIMVNNFINAWDLPNYPEYLNNGKVSGHFATEGFNYQRPYSFAAMANVSAPIMVAIFSIIKSTTRSQLGILSILILTMMSGTGIVALLVLFILRKEFLLIIVSGIGFILLNFYLDNNLSTLINSRVGIDQIYDIIILKYNQIIMPLLGQNIFTELGKNNESVESLINIVSQYSFHNYLFGGLEILARLNNGYGGDFGWLWLYTCYGLLPFLFYIVFIFTKINKSNFIPITILVIATFHYPVIFYLSGQIIFAYALSITEKTKSPIT